MARDEDATIHLNCAREAERNKDFLRTRVEYLKCVESWKQGGNSQMLKDAQDEYDEFVRRDPIFKTLLNGLLPIIKENPNIIQSEITKQFESIDWTALYNYNRTITKEDIYYALYFAARFGIISRTKKGHSYELNLINKEAIK